MGEFYIEEQADWGSFVPSEKRKKSLAVKIVSVDKFLAGLGLDKVSFVRIDIEG